MTGSSLNEFGIRKGGGHCLVDFLRIWEYIGYFPFLNFKVCTIPK